ncbi:sensor histidine kinase [Cohnella cellulosilytica]|uniref:Sensor histidine kinase n=1 Tax=Cohnella cellulosilytica TaxID=986710 RepID=A0ABW2F6W7_9BACL
MNRSLNNVRLRHKLLLIYFLSVFFPILLTNLFFYSVTAHNVRSQREKDAAQALERIHGELQARIDTAVGISSVFYADSVVNEALERTYDSPIAYLDVYDEALRASLAKYAPVYGFIQSMTIYTDNPTVLGSGGIGFIDETVKRANWYGKVAEAGGMPVFVHDGRRGSSPFSVVRKLNAFSSRDEYEKVLKIDLHRDAIAQALGNMGFPGDLYLLGPDRAIELATGPGTNGGDGPVRFDDLPVPDGSRVLVQPYSRANELYGWALAGVIPKGQALAGTGEPRRLALYLTCVNLLLPTLVLVWIAKSLHDRLLRIVRQIKKVKRGNFEPIAEEEAEAAKDEIGQLSAELNRMTRQIRELIDEALAAEIERKDLELQRRRAQIHALQSQINPHFLFNVLETLRMRSLIKGETETAQIVRNMAKLFRKSLSWGNDWITAGQELDLIRSFLEIQKYRFGDRLQYRIEANGEAAQSRIPKMVFLPFVENASLHGVEKIEAQGVIELVLSLDRDGLLFLLRDNGGGMDEPTLRKVLSERPEEEEDETHVGIRNVRSRLALYYGDRATLDIASTPGCGTSVRIRLPHPL